MCVFFDGLRTQIRDGGGLLGRGVRGVIQRMKMAVVVESRSAVAVEGIEV